MIKLSYFPRGDDGLKDTYVEIPISDTWTIQSLKTRVTDQIRTLCAHMGVTPYSWQILDITFGPVSILESVIMPTIPPEQGNIIS